MRDLETIELALTAAATGHLVFGTLHTSSREKQWIALSRLPDQSTESNPRHARRIA